VEGRIQELQGGCQELRRPDLQDRPFPGGPDEGGVRRGHCEGEEGGQDGDDTGLPGHRPPRGQHGGPRAFPQSRDQDRAADVQHGQQRRRGHHGEVSGRRRPELSGAAARGEAQRAEDSRGYRSLRLQNHTGRRRGIEGPRGGDPHGVQGRPRLPPREERRGDKGHRRGGRVRGDLRGSLLLSEGRDDDSPPPRRDRPRGGGRQRGPRGGGAGLREPVRPLPRGGGRLDIRIDVEQGSHYQVRHKRLQGRARRRPQAQGGVHRDVPGLAECH